MDTKDQSAAAQYDRIAAEYAERVDSWPGLVGYERPAMLSLLPDVSGNRVLDAGCGTGWYADWLLEHGAEVAAIDASTGMVEQARDRLNDRAPVQQADLNESLPFEKDTFDIVVSGLAFDYVEDWESLFTELRRILVPGGVLVFSVRHPLGGIELFDSISYLKKAEVTEEHEKFDTSVEIPSYHRPFDVMINTLLDAGFTLGRVLEPEPTDELEELAPEQYDHLSQRPTFLCIRAQNPKPA